MRSFKYHQGFWLISGFLFAFLIGATVSQNMQKQIRINEFKKIQSVLYEAKRDPDKKADQFFELLEDRRYSKFAYANIMALLMADSYRPEKSGVVYTRAMHVMDEENIKNFLEKTYDRLMEKDREAYEAHTFKFPKNIENNIKNMFSNRPVFMFSPKESLAIRDCLGMGEHAKVETKSSKVKDAVGIDHDRGCKPLMKIHNNINL